MFFKTCWLRQVGLGEFYQAVPSCGWLHLEIRVTQGFMKGNVIAYSELHQDVNGLSLK